MAFTVQAKKKSYKIPEQQLLYQFGYVTCVKLSYQVDDVISQLHFLRGILSS